MKKTLTVILLGVFVWGLGLVWFATTIPAELNKTASKKTADAVVVLTGGAERLQEGLRLYTNGYADYLLISGVGRYTNLTSLLSMSGPLPDNIEQYTANITLDYEALDTRGNAIQTAQWVREHNIESILLVTANYHMPRSLIEFKAYLKKDKILPYPVFPKGFYLKEWWNDANSRNIVISEYNKYLLSYANYAIFS